ncbi:RnfABCDGE type electron transport complex subunit D [Candidatus Kaiserbacteria bacterium]|nr:RnfABCDGE type electron transport complex subunit D [Candidatus Kaiserbacteria bacterium]
MFTFIDDFLNKTTMFRLLAYYLGALLTIAAVFSALHILPYDPINVLMSAGFLVAISWLSNAIFARLRGVPINAESSLITGLILALIIAPKMPDANVLLLAGSAILAIASKYIINIRGKHIFNPVAFGAAAAAIIFSQSATWWIGGNIPMTAFVGLGGILVVRKIRRADLVLSFLAVALAGTLAYMRADTSTLFNSTWNIFTHTPLLFFAFVMITEPLTTPPQRMGRILYGSFVGLLFVPWVHIGSLYFTPELALLAGNMLSYAISPKFKALLQLNDLRKIATDTYEFVFSGEVPAFKPGQYAEWTLTAPSSDARGNRRHFTLASSPTEPDVRIGVKFYAKPSSYKTFLADFKAGTTILVGNIAGDFVLPKRHDKKLAFIAGGIGVTPFRSMVKYMVDRKEKRDAVLLYSNKTEGEIAYKDVFDAAQAAGIGFRAVYTLTEPNISPGWTGQRGFIDTAMIAREMPDYQERTFYISGPRSMVDAFKKTLRHMGVSRFKIKTDYFPGFA